LVRFCESKKWLKKNGDRSDSYGGTDSTSSDSYDGAATIIGILPIAIGFGASGELVAVGCCGGFWMTTSTFLNFIVFRLCMWFFQPLDCQGKEKRNEKDFYDGSLII